MRTTIIALVFITLVVFVSMPLANVPGEISFQGKLTDSGTGDPVADGTYDLTFTIYDTATGGSALWTETQAGVSVEGGLYSVMLGSGTPFPNSLKFDDQYWLGVQVDADPEMSPRYQLGASPYALNYADKIRASETKLLVSDDNYGLQVIDSTGLAIAGFTHSITSHHAGVYGFAGLGSEASAIRGVSNGHGYAGYFDGDVSITESLEDSDGDAGTAGQLFSSTGAGTDWVSFDSALWTDGGTYISPLNNSNVYIFDDGENDVISVTSATHYAGRFTYDSDNLAVLASSDGYGLFAKGDSYGVRGMGNSGHYGQLGTPNFAGQFNGDVYIYNSTAAGANNAVTEIYTNGSVTKTNALLAVSNSNGDTTGTEYSKAWLAGYDFGPTAPNMVYGVWGHTYSTGALEYSVVGSYGANPLAPENYAYLASQNYAGYFYGDVKIKAPTDCRHDIFVVEDSSGDEIFNIGEGCWNRVEIGENATLIQYDADAGGVTNWEIGPDADLKLGRPIGGSAEDGDIIVYDGSGNETFTVDGLTGDVNIEGNLDVTGSVKDGEPIKISLNGLDFIGTSASASSDVETYYNNDASVEAYEASSDNQGILLASIPFPSYLLGDSLEIDSLRVFYKSDEADDYITLTQLRENTFDDSYTAITSSYTDRNSTSVDSYKMNCNDIIDLSTKGLYLMLNIHYDDDGGTVIIYGASIYLHRI